MTGHPIGKPPLFCKAKPSPPSERLGCWTMVPMLTSILKIMISPTLMGFLPMFRNRMSPCTHKRVAPQRCDVSMHGGTERGGLQGCHLSSIPRPHCRWLAGCAACWGQAWERAVARLEVHTPTWVQMCGSMCRSAHVNTWVEMLIHLSAYVGATWAMAHPVAT